MRKLPKAEVKRIRAEGAAAARQGVFRSAPYRERIPSAQWYVGYDLEHGRMKQEREAAWTKRLMERIAKQ